MTRRLPALIAILAVATPATGFAGTPLTLYPVRVGDETARFYRGEATLTLTTPEGAVEVRPIRTGDKEIVLSVAVVNTSSRAADIGVENITAQVNGRPVALPNHDQLVDAAQTRARQQRLATALVTGVIAGVASTASTQHSYQQNLYTRHGAYARTITWEDNTPGVLGATAAVAGGALVMTSINQKLDYTLDQLNNEVLETTTVDPGSSFGGTVVVPIPKDAVYPSEIRVQVRWNGAVYPFGLRLTPSGVDAPPPFSDPVSSPPPF